MVQWLGSNLVHWVAKFLIRDAWFVNRDSKKAKIKVQIAKLHIKIQK